MLQRSDLRYLLLAAVVVLFGLFNSGLDETLAASNPPPHTSALRRPLVKLAYHFRLKTNEERFYHCFGQMALGRQHDYEFLVKHRGDLGKYLRGMVGPETITGPVLPYRDYIAEYPPANFPFIAAPALAGEKLMRYAMTFRVMLGLLNALALLFFLRFASKLGFTATEQRRFLVLSLVGALMLGPIMVTRLDPITLFFLASAFLATSSDRPVTAGVMMALAAGAKIVPVFLMPFFFLHWALSGERGKALRFGLASAAGLGAVFLPALFAGPDNFRALFAFHGERPVQVESTFAVLLRLQEHLFGTSVNAVHSFGSWNLSAPLAPFLRSASTPLALLTVASMLWVYRGWLVGSPEADKSTREESLLRACGATVAGLMFFSKVFSPQYLIWTWPWFFLVDRNKRFGVSLVTLTTLFLTQLIALPYATEVVKGDLTGTLLLGARNLCLLTLLLLMARRPGAPSERPSETGKDWGWKTALLPLFLALLSLGIHLQSKSFEARWMQPVPRTNPEFVLMELNSVGKGQAIPRRGYGGLEINPDGSTFAWTFEAAVRHYFPPAIPDKAYIFKLRGLDSLSPEFVGGMTLTVNGKPIPLWSPGDSWPMTFAAYVPPDFLKTDSWNNLVLHTPPPVSPKSVGRGSDFRELGIMVDSVSFSAIDGFAEFPSPLPEEALRKFEGWVRDENPAGTVRFYRPGDFSADFARLPVAEGWSKADGDRADRPYRRLDGSGKLNLQLPAGRHRISFTVLKEVPGEKTPTVEVAVEGAGDIYLTRRESEWETTFEGEFDSPGGLGKLTFFSSQSFGEEPMMGVLTIRPDQS